MSKHAQGPWYAENPRFCQVRTSEPTRKNKDVIADVHGWDADGESMEVRKANARLIAAAPDLLSAVEMALIEATTLEPRLTAPFAGSMRILAERCKAAIAKATETP